MDNNFKLKSKETTPSREPIFEELDLSKAETWRGLEGDKDFIIERLKALGLYNPNLIFRGFHLDQLSAVKRKGVDIPSDERFYGSLVSELVKPDLAGSNGESALEHALRGDNVVPGCLAVYDKEKFRPGMIDYTYILKAGITYKDALIAVFILKNKA